MIYLNPHILNQGFGESKSDAMDVSESKREGQELPDIILERALVKLGSEFVC